MKNFYLMLMMSFLFACSHTPSSENNMGGDSVDPFESFNRTIFDFNTSADEYVLAPLASGYQAITPDYVEERVSDFFQNIGDVKTMFNQVLQGKIVDAVGSFGRVILNSTVGVFGLFDVASDMNIPRKKEDFGQTLATWGVASGPYLVLPIFGPSTLRDTVGLVGDSWHQVDLISYFPDESDQWALRVLKAIDTRVKLDAVFDITYRKNEPYLFARESFLQKRNFDINDGQVENDFEDDF